MDLKKVKEALSMASFELPDLSSAPNGKEPHAIKAARLVKEAIAELEKPVDEDIIKFLCGDKDYFILRGQKVNASTIQQYAESYHAQKLAEIAQKAEQFYCKQCTCRFDCVSGCENIKQLKAIITA